MYPMLIADFPKYRQSNGGYVARYAGSAASPLAAAPLTMLTVAKRACEPVVPRNQTLLDQLKTLLPWRPAPGQPIECEGRVPLIFGDIARLGRVT